MLSLVPMKIIAAIALILVLIVLFALIAALPLMLLWNWLMPVLFGVPTIGFLQALGLLVLSGLLFKSSSVKSS
jgi:hypothetical protein